MSYFGFKSYENELIKEILEKSEKEPIELIKSFSPVLEEEIGSINSLSSCEMFFSVEAYSYKIYWGLIIYFLESNDNFEIENKWLKIALLIFGHLEKEIIEDEFLNKSWISSQKRKHQLKLEKEMIENKIKHNQLLPLNVTVQ